MKNKKTDLKTVLIPSFLCAAGALALISSCSLEAKKNPTLYLSFDPQAQQKDIDTSELNPKNWFLDQSISHLEPVVIVSGPPALSQFKCIGVNVVGPGIREDGNGNFTPGMRDRVRQLQDLTSNSCSYPGVMSVVVKDPGANTQVDVTLDVPAGPDRIVQVFGVSNDILTAPSPVPSEAISNICDSGSNIAQTIDSLQLDSNIFYELGRAHIPSLYSAQSISITSKRTATWHDQTQVMDCGD